MNKIVDAIILEKAKNGSVTGKAKLQTGMFTYLHSKYNPEEEAQTWVKNIYLEPNTLYLVLGFGLGYHVRALLKQLPDNCMVMVIDFSQEENLSKFAYHNLPATSWMMDDRLKIYCGPNIRVLAGILVSELGKMMIKRVTKCYHYPTMQIYRDFYQKVDCELVARAEEIFKMNATFADEAKEITSHNFWRNIRYISQNPGITAFKNRFKGIPAIIVSSGPSLNKNIKQLHDCEGKAIIIASGSAMGPLHKHKITPHFLAVADTFPGMYESLKGKFYPQTTLLCYYETACQVVSNYPGKVCFCTKDNSVLCPKEMQAVLPPTDSLLLSGSVAMTAFQFAKYSGADPIIFIGQDCAFAPDAVYADGVGSTYDLEKWASNITTVIGCNGEVLKTDLVYKEVLDAFVVAISELNGTREIINATEGGAYMTGAEHLSLAQATKQYCTRKHDLQAKIHKILDGSNSYDSNPLITYLNNLSKDFEALQAVTEDSIESSSEYSSSAFIDGKISVKIDVEAACERNFSQQMELFLANVKKSMVYPYMQTYLEPLFNQFIYQQRDGLSTAEEMAGYCLLRSHVLIILSRLIQYIREALDSITLGTGVADYE